MLTRSSRRLATIISALFLAAVAASAAPVVLSTNGSSPTIAAAADSVAVLWHESDGLHHALVDLSGRIVASGTLPQSTGAAAARVASDGYGYLLVWIDAADASARIAVLDSSGHHGPVYTIGSEARADVAPVVTWDGTRYLVFWSATGGTGQSARFAEVTPQGASFGANTLASVPYVANVISSNGSTTIVWSTIEILNAPQGFGSSQINLATLANGAVSARTTVTKHFWLEVQANSDRDQSLALIGNQLYVSWVSPRMGSLTGVMGTRVAADGAPLDFSDPRNTTTSGKVVFYEFSRSVSTQLRSFAIDSQYVLVWRQGSREWVARVGPDGNISTPLPLMTIDPEVLQSSDVAHLGNWQFAIAYGLAPSHRVELLFTARSGPKRRAIR